MAIQCPISSLRTPRARASILTCPPRLIRGNETELLEMVLPLIQTSCILLDMSGVQAIDAAGVGTLAVLRRTAKEAGTTLSLINPTRRTREILQLFGLDSILLCNAAA
ncbi:MAG TPA: STAS domain-containing protein [Acidisarcina sp.]|nr:STAS domain-containing protein [Acidisarcina sp.]